MIRKNLPPKRKAAYMKRARILTTGIRLESWESWKVPNAGDTYECTATNRFGIPVGLHEVEAAKYFIRDWEITLKVKYLNEEGLEAIDELPIVIRQIRLNEPQEFLKEQRAQLGNEISGQILDRGWVAVALN